MFVFDVAADHTFTSPTCLGAACGGGGGGGRRRGEWRRRKRRRRGRGEGGGGGSHTKSPKKGKKHTQRGDETKSKAFTTYSGSKHSEEATTATGTVSTATNTDNRKQRAQAELHPQDMVKRTFQSKTTHPDINGNFRLVVMFYS